MARFLSMLNIPRILNHISDLAIMVPAADSAPLSTPGGPLLIILPAFFGLSTFEEVEILEEIIAEDGIVPTY